MSAEVVLAPEDKRSLVFSVLSDLYRQEKNVDQLRLEFARQEYVRLPRLLSDDAFALVKAEVDRLEQFARRRNFVMSPYQTPRIMKPLSGKVIMCESPLLCALYVHHEIRNLVEDVVGTQVYTCLNKTEWMVANYLDQKGDTQGSHLDVPAFALILFLYSPSADKGGLLEFVRYWRELSDARGIQPKSEVDPVLLEHLRAAGLVQIKHHEPGDAYLLRADHCLHRVTPLTTDGARRVVLNMAFDASLYPDQDDTAPTLYDQID